MHRLCRIFIPRFEVLPGQQRPEGDEKIQRRCGLDGPGQAHFAHEVEARDQYAHGCPKAVGKVEKRKGAPWFTVDTPEHASRHHGEGGSEQDGLGQDQ